MEILWENTISPEFRVNHPKPWWNYAFPPSFHARKLGEITIFYVVDPAPSLSLFRKLNASFIKEFFFYKQSFASLLQGFPKLVIATLNDSNTIDDLHFVWTENVNIMEIWLKRQFYVFLQWRGFVFLEICFSIKNDLVRHLPWK